MTFRKVIHKTVFSCRAIFLFKAYIIIVPLTVVICQICAPTLESNKSHAHKMSYWDERLVNKLLGAEMARIFRAVEVGYCLALLAFTIDAVVSRSKRNTKEFRTAVLFATLSLFSVITAIPQEI
jgi:hypothetical protein